MVSSGAGKSKDGRGKTALPLETRGCPVCSALTDDLIEYLSGRQKLLADDDAAQREYAGGGGYCSFHTWQLAAFSSSRGIAAGHRRIMQCIADRLAQLADAATGCTELPLFSEACPVCKFIIKKEIERVDSLASFLEDRQGRLAYAGSQGVCLCHMRMVCAAAGSETVTRFLLNETAKRFSEIALSMENSVRKHEARERHLLSPDERDAVYRGLVRIAGGKQLSVPLIFRGR